MSNTLRLKDIANVLVGSVILVDEYESFEYHLDFDGPDFIPRDLYDKRVLTICGEGADLLYIVLVSDDAEKYDESDLKNYRSEARYLD